MAALTFRAASPGHYHTQYPGHDKAEAIILTTLLRNPILNPVSRIGKQYSGRNFGKQVCPCHKAEIARYEYLNKACVRKSGRHHPNNKNKTTDWGYRETLGRLYNFTSHGSSLAKKTIVMSWPGRGMTSMT